MSPFLVALVLAQTPADADALGGRVAARTGDPAREPGLAFTFVVSTSGTATRRDHRWDVPGGRVEVRWTEDGRACRAVVPIPYVGDDPLLIKAWRLFVNDQYWLLAPAKVMDPGVRREAEGSDLRLSFAGVGITPGDRYTLHTTAAGDVSGWDYLLEGGKPGSWQWSPSVPVGGLRLSLERTTTGRTIRFEDVVSAPQALGAVGGECAG